MKRLQFGTYNKFEGTEVSEYIDNIQIYNDEGNLVYIAILTERDYIPGWFNDFVSDPEFSVDRIIIYKLLDGAKLLLRKYKGAEKVYIEAKVADPVLGDIVHYSLIEV